MFANVQACQKGQSRGGLGSPWEMVLAQAQAAGLVHVLLPLCLSSLCLFLSWYSSPRFGPCLPTFISHLWACGGGRLSGQADPPGLARLVARSCGCVQRGLGVERNWREVVRVPGWMGEGCFLSPPPPRPGLLTGWQLPGLLFIAGEKPVWPSPGLGPQPAPTPLQIHFPGQRWLLGVRALCWTAAEPQLTGVLLGRPSQSCPSPPSPLAAPLRGLPRGPLGPRVALARNQHPRRICPVSSPGCHGRSRSPTRAPPPALFRPAPPASVRRRQQGRPAGGKEKAPKGRP